MRKAAKSFGAALTLAILLSGCVSKVGPEPNGTPPLPSISTRPGPSLPPTINETVDLFTLKPEMVDCQFFVLQMQLPQADVQQALPPGYEAQGLGSPAAAQVNIQLEHCKALVINNETVVPSMFLAQTVARVRVNETLGKGATLQTYAMELFASNETVANLLGALGFNVTFANITLETMGSFSTVRISVRGAVWYEIQGTNGYGRPIEWADRERLHQVGDTGGALWINRNRTYEFAELGGHGRVTVSGGILQSIRPGETGTIAGETALAPTAAAELTFGRR